jgi:hypothetical protein
MNIGGGKKANNRRYPGVRGKRPDNKKFRKEEAKERQAFYDGLSIKEKLEHIARQIKTMGGEAKKQIQKLQALLETGSLPVVEQKETSSTTEEITEEPKKMKAKDRRKAEQDSK